VLIWFEIFLHRAGGLKRLLLELPEADVLNQYKNACTGKPVQAFIEIIPILKNNLTTLARLSAKRTIL
jgi:hypothetical protein